MVDVDRESPGYGEIVHRTEMPNIGDELHHFGWNACSSACHSQLQRDTMIVPGLRSSRIHIIDISEPRQPRIKNVIEGEEIKQKLGLSGPHTVHCMPGDIVTISMLGDADGNLPGGFAVLDARDFTIAERWEREKNGQEFMYDFWYQPRQNTLVSSEWARAKHLPGRLQPCRRRGRQVRPAPALLGSGARAPRCRRSTSATRADPARDPLAARPRRGGGVRGRDAVEQHHPTSHARRDNGSWSTEKVIDVANEELEGWPLEGGVPGLITDLVFSLDDHDLFFSNWLHGDLRHYDVSDPRKPQLRSQVWLGGLLGRDGGHPKASGPLNGGPQMLQNSLDGQRVYVSNSLYSTWDNQFYPGLRGWLTKLDRQSDGTYALDPDFFVDFYEQAEGARPHEIHLPGGDCTTEIFQ